ncbi:hypothetical protein [cf. Phormidesmis sp. LEGE 11477]|uniref:hypothetical protein n=1 Tax=cf. Phormidesmis sp. LEGE 11477 TaxID=1828680 RepID=UPI001882F4C0|nr:hypothetical protein [cf. Phormidesmis sp. LEGE 11477]MBE9060798.1 hypothetical protein [cf. Phormidesmis sp. LEGE 11477]
MASSTQVKNYLAYWLQLGKPIVTADGQIVCQPKKVIHGDRFSTEFEDCWAKVMSREGTGYYLRGTDQSIADLLSPGWEMASCARCNMIVPTPEVLINTFPCPCHDLADWPNEEVPQPRLPINSQKRLSQIQQRMASKFDSD